MVRGGQQVIFVSKAWLGSTSFVTGEQGWEDLAGIERDGQGLCD